MRSIAAPRTRSTLARSAISESRSSPSADPAITPPLRIAFLGCGFITRIHSRHLRALRRWSSDPKIAWGYASREKQKAERFCRRYGGSYSYDGYAAAVEDP